MPKLTFDLSNLKGLAPLFYGDKTGSGTVNRVILGKEGQLANGTNNPFLMPGYLNPGVNDLTALTADQTVGGYIIATAISSDNSIWFLAGTPDTTGSIFRLDGPTDTSLSERDAFTGTGTDAIMYTINGNEYVFYSFKHATAADIEAIRINNNSLNNAWLSGTASGGAYLGNNNHRMIVADNGFMYVLDGNAVHKIDGTTATGGTNGTATMNILLFPSTFQLLDGVDTRGQLWISLMQDTRDINTIPTFSFNKTCGVYIWDRLSTTIRMRDFIPIEAATEIRYMFLLDGIPGCFTRGTDGYTQLRLFNGSKFEIIKELGQNDYPRFHGSIANIPGGILWTSVNADLFFYGKIIPEMESRELYRIADWRASTEQAGACLPVMDSTTYLIFWSRLLSGTYSVQRQTLNDRAVIPTGNISYTIVKPLPKLSTTKGITLFHLPITNTGTLTDDALQVHVYFNQDTSTTATFHISQNDGSKTYQWFPLVKRNVNWVQLGFEWNTNNPINRGLAPIYSELEYEIEETKKK